MAKKKMSTAERLIKTPFSLKNVLTTVIVIGSVLYLNTSVLSQQKVINKPEASNTLSQSQLQNVLGTSISIGEKPKQNSNNHNDQISKYWLNILSTNPNYRDAYLILAVQAFNNRDCANTKWYLDKAVSLDLNNPLIPDLTDKMQTCLEPQ